MNDNRTCKTKQIKLSGVYVKTELNFRNLIKQFSLVPYLLLLTSNSFFQPMSKTRFSIIQLSYFYTLVGNNLKNFNLVLNQFLKVYLQTSCNSCIMLIFY